MFTMDGPVTVLAGTDGAAVKGLPELQPDTPPQIAAAFPFAVLDRRAPGLVLLRDGSPAGVARFVAEFGRRGVPVTVRHTFGPVGASRPALPPQRGAQHTF